MEHRQIKKSTEVTLDRLCERERGWIAAIPCDHPLAGRLCDMGWIAGSEVICLYKGPSGDPVAYRVAGVTVAMRLCDAAGIFISLQGGDAAPEREEAYETLWPDGCIYGAYGDYGGEDDVGNLMEGGDTYETAR